jgi:hypothetical protein
VTLECANGDPEFLKTVITGDETWVYGYDPETKVQSSQWKHSSSPTPKKAQRVWSIIKVLLTVFFDYCGIVHHSYAPEGQTINKEYYLEVIRHVRDAVRRMRLDPWASRNWQCPSSFITPDPEFPGQTWHSSCLPGSILSRHGSL